MWKQKSWMMIDSFYNHIIINIIALFGLHIFTIYNNKKKNSILWFNLFLYRYFKLDKTEELGITL